MNSHSEDQQANFAQACGDLPAELPETETSRFDLTPEQEAFCDSHCCWSGHHKDCPRYDPPPALSIARAAGEAAGVKVCKTCGNVKPLEDFNLALVKRGAPGLRKTECKKCQYAAHGNYVNENRARIRGYHGEKDRVRTRKYWRDGAANLTDRYVLKRLLGANAAPQALIDAKRTQVLIQRFIQEQAK